MLVYVVMSEIENGDRNVLGVAGEKNQALRMRGEYAAEHEEENCWIQEFDTDHCAYEAEEEYHMIHQTRVHRVSGLTTHIIVFTKETFPLVEEEGDWYVIRREESSFDKEAGVAKNLEILEDYNSCFGHIIPSVLSREEFEK